VVDMSVVGDDISARRLGGNSAKSTCWWYHQSLSKAQRRFSLHRVSRADSMRAMFNSQTTDSMVNPWKGVNAVFAMNPTR